MSSGGGQTSTNTVTQSDPWSGQQKYLLDLFNRAKAARDTGGPQQYGGQSVAAPGTATTQAQGMVTDQAQGNMTQNADAASKALQFNLTDARDVNSNPYLKSAISAAIQPAVNQFQDAGGTLSQLRDQSADTGTGYGYGSRGDIASGLAASRLNKDILGTTSAMSASGYQSGLDASSRALGQVGQVQAASAAPGEALSAVGNQQDTYQQALINDAINRWNFDQNREGNANSAYQNLIQGSFGGQQTGTGQGPSYAPGAMQNVATGATAAYMSYLLYAAMMA